jgi:hypothetical protein
MRKVLKWAWRTSTPESEQTISAAAKVMHGERAALTSALDESGIDAIGGQRF